MFCSSFAVNLRLSHAILQTRTMRSILFCNMARKSFPLRQKAAKTNPHLPSRNILQTIIPITLSVSPSAAIARTGISPTFPCISHEKRKIFYNAPLTAIVRGSFLWLNPLRPSFPHRQQYPAQRPR